jgi:hypothetical protein
MNTRTWFALAGVAAGSVSLGMLAIAVPKTLWTTDVIVTAIVLFLSFGSPAFLAAPMLKGHTTDAPFIWLMGPLGRFWLLLLMVAATGVRFSLVGWHRASWVTCVGWFGICSVGFAILKASTEIVGVAASQTRISGTDARSKWIRLVQTLQIQAENNEVQRALERMTEKVQFAANESPVQESRENQEIDEVLGQLKANFGKPDEVTKLIRSAEGLLTQREQSLRASRTRA